MSVSAVPSSRGTDMPEDLDLMDVVRTLWRGKLWIALGGVLGLVCALLLSTMRPAPIYTATATVGFQSPVSAQVVYQATLLSMEMSMKSPPLLDKLVTKLDLMSDPEFNPAAGREGAEDNSETRSRVIARLSDRISVLNLRQTYVFNIRATSEDAVKATQIASGLAELYVEENGARFEALIAKLIWTNSVSDNSTPAQVTDTLRRWAESDTARQLGDQIYIEALVPLVPSNAGSANSRTIGLIILGSVLAAVLVILQELRRNTYRLGKGLARTTGLPVLAQIPEVNFSKNGSLSAYARKKPKSAAAAAIRSLRISLLQGTSPSPQVILCVGSVPHEGALETAKALSDNLAGLGHKVLLMNTDASKTDDPMRAGEKLEAVLAGDMPLADAVTTGSGLDVLWAVGTQLPLADLYGTPAFAALLNQAKQAYDYIIVAGAPLLVVPDARLLAGLVDAVVHVVRWDKTDRSQLAEALRGLATVGVVPAGFVLSYIDPPGMRHYGYGWSHGAFGRFGQNYYEE